MKLRNEMTQKAIAKECADWIRRKVQFKSNTTGENMGGFVTVENKQHQVAYMPINGFTTVDIGCERGNIPVFPQVGHILHYCSKRKIPESDIPRCR